MGILDKLRANKEPDSTKIDFSKKIVDHGAGSVAVFEIDEPDIMDQKIANELKGYGGVNKDNIVNAHNFLPDNKFSLQDQEDQIAMGGNNHGRKQILEEVFHKEEGRVLSQEDFGM